MRIVSGFLGVMLLAFLFLVVIAAAGCATTPEAPPRVSTVTNIVSVPVPVACIAAADIPPIPTPVPIAVGATHDQIDAANSVDLLAMDQFAAIVTALLNQCSKAAP